MKKLAILFPVLFLVGLMACTNPYQTARSTITIGRGAVVMAEVGFNTYVKVESDRCTASCKTDPSCLEKCLAPVEKNKVIWGKSKATAIAGLNTAETLVNTAEALGKKETVDWIVPLKATSCLIATSLDWLPAAYKAKIQALLDLLSSFGCPKA
jgi:hypothetical protein